MKIVFLEDNHNIKEFETETQDLKQMFQIADKLSDTELNKIKNVIHKIEIPKLINIANKY